MSNAPDEPTTLPSALAELSGTVLEQRYELGRVLGAGGMGAVFEAKHLRLDRTVAIKVLRPVFLGQQEYIKRFLREAQAASKIRHRNVVEILDYGETGDGLVYSVMEFLHGRDLQKTLRSQPQRRLPWPLACQLLAQIAAGLKAAHACGVIHRDIKPANCFVTEEDGEPQVKLVDFGIAKVDDADQTNQLTATSQVLGTPSYIAPEMIRTKSPASPRSDIYSMGVVAYRTLVGRLPFSGETAFEVMRKSCFDPVPSLREQVPDLPPALEHLVLQMLAKEPEDRPGDMLLVRQQLLAIAEGATPVPTVVRTAGTEVLETALPAGAAVPPLHTTMPHDVGLTPPQAHPTGAGADVDPMQPADAAATAVADPGPFTPSSSPSALDQWSPAGGSPPLTPGSAPLPIAPAAAEAVETTPGGSRRPRTMLAPGGPPPVAASGDPMPPVFDPGSTPPPSMTSSRGSETVPVVDDATLQTFDSVSFDRPRRRGALWLGLAGVAAVVAVGALALPSLLADDGPDEVVTTRNDVTAPAPAEPGPPSEPAADPTPSDDPTPEADPQPAVAEPETPTPDPEPPAPEQDAPAPEPETPSASPKPTPSKPRARPKASGPPSDSSLTKKLERRIKSKCGKQLGRERVTVSFLVNEDGRPIALNASPNDDGGRCATQQVKGTVFRTRDRKTPFKITVN